MMLAAEDASAVTISATVLCWIGGVLVAALGSIGTFCGHMLIVVHRDLQDIKTEARVSRAEIGKDIESLKRHGDRNTREIELLRRFEREHPEDAEV